MKFPAMLSLLLITLTPQFADAQRPLVRMPPGIGAHAKSGSRVLSTLEAAPATDSARSALTINVVRGAAAGVLIGGVIGAFASEHQATGAGFTHTPAVLFVATYGGLGVLLGIIAGTMLPGS